MAKRIIALVAAALLLVTGAVLGLNMAQHPTADQYCANNGLVAGTPAYANCMGQILGVRNQ